MKLNPKIDVFVHFLSGLQFRGMAMGIIAAGAVGVYTGFYWMPIGHFISLDPWRVAGVPMDTQGVLIIIVTVCWLSLTGCC